MKRVLFLLFVCSSVSVQANSLIPKAGANIWSGIKQTLPATAIALKERLVGFKNRAQVKVLAGGLIMLTACAGITGCARDDVIEVNVDITPLLGEDVYFTLDGRIYQGYVEYGYEISEQVRVDLDNGGKMLVSAWLVGGVLVPDHPDIDTSVVLLGNEGSDVDIMFGVIRKVYDDGTREIYIDSYWDHDGKRISVEPYSIFANSNDSLEDGGYKYEEDFFQD